MGDFLVGMMNIDAYTASVAVTLVGVAALLLNLSTGSRMLALAYVPAMGFFALATKFGLSELGVSITSYQRANIILGLTLGLVLGFLFMIGATRLYFVVTDIRRPVTNENPSEIEE